MLLLKIKCPEIKSTTGMYAKYCNSSENMAKLLITGGGNQWPPFKRV
jgi:hypothetical protein